MRIGVVSHMFPTSRQPAFGQFVREELDYLARQVEIRLFAPRLTRYWFEGNPPTNDRSYPVKRPFQPSLPGWFLHHRNPDVMSWYLRRYRRSLFAGCDLVHAHQAFPEAIAAVRVFEPVLPVVITVHGTDINVFASRPRLRDGIRAALNRARYIIAVSESLRERLEELGVTTPVRVIPNGVDVEKFSPGDKETACARLGLDPGRPRILYAGNFKQEKNVEQLIGIMPRILERYPESELVLVGAVRGNPLVRKCRELIFKRGIGESVSIRPMVPHEELPPWYRASDMLVLPSLREGFGLVLAEALACGRPVVATKSGGPERIVEKGLGFLVRPNDDDELLGAIFSVLAGKDVEGPDILAESARRRFSYDGVVRDILDVYREVLGENLRGG